MGERAFLGLARCVVGMLALAVVQMAVAEDAAPRGLARSDWKSIRDAYESSRHAVAAVAGGHEARNPGQRWRTRFDGRGMETAPEGGGWKWGLELVSWGVVGAERTVGVPECVEARGGRLEYEWSEGLTEWYVNDRGGLEHGFTVRERPGAGEGPLCFTLAVRGGLRPRVSGDGRGVAFVRAEWESVVNYSGLTVFDARGANVGAWFEGSGDGLRLVVDDQGARYPLTIDPIAQQAYLKASNPEANDNFGGAVAVSGDTVVVGARVEDSSAFGVDGNQASNTANGSGAAYVFVRAGAGWTQQAYLKASNTEAFDSFGIALAISGDTVVVGASAEDSNGLPSDNSALNAGAAYVFVRSGTTWTQQAYLKASNTGAGDEFGRSVSVSGDTVVIGAELEDSAAVGVDGDGTSNAATSAGAAYVFVRSGSVWSQQAYLKASNTEASDAFGVSVAVSGDTVVVGADGEDSNSAGVNGNQADNSSAGAGAAYVFVRSGTVWSQQAYLKASNASTADGFGSAVGVSGDTIVVGAIGEDSDATGVNGNQNNNTFNAAGAAYVFVRSGAAWSQQAYLKASNTGINDNFGEAVAISGNAVVVGARVEDSNATGVNGNQADNTASGAGAAYVFTRSGSAWSQHAYLKGSNTGTGDFFGVAVGVSDSTVVVGAEQEDSNAAGVNGDQSNDGALGAGAAYVFQLDCTGGEPGITQQPGRANVLSGGQATYTIIASSPAGFGAPAYQWRRDGAILVNGGAIAGATGAMLTINPVTMADDGAAFDCVVSNFCGSVRSDPAGLGVTTSCPADFNLSGMLETADVFAFLNAWFAGCP